MSADNGVYILETKGPEYRVAYAHAIENIFNDAGMIREYFDESEIFFTRKKALDKASEIYDNVKYTEYGVVVIDTYFDRDYYSF
jgi:hypothetical protein